MDHLSGNREIMARSGEKKAREHRTYGNERNYDLRIVQIKGRPIKCIGYQCLTQNNWLS